MKLHALWIRESGVMAFWAEDRKVYSQPRLHKRYLDRGVAPLHPYSVVSEKLIGLLPESLDAFQDVRIVLCPSESQQPFPSWQQIVPSRVEPVRWTVATCETLVENFVEFFLFHDLDQFIPEEMWADDFKYWIRLLHFARDLFEAQHSAPASLFLEGKCYPAWHCIFSAPAMDAFKRFVKNAPPSCVANYLAPPFFNYEEIVSGVFLNFLDFCMDTLARRTILRKTRVRLDSKARGKVTGSLPQQWIHLLKAGRFQALNARHSLLQQFSVSTRNWIARYRPADRDNAWMLQLCVDAPDSADGEWHIRLFLNYQGNAQMKLAATQFWDQVFSGSISLEAFWAFWQGVGELCTLFPPIKQQLKENPHPQFFSFFLKDATFFMEEVAPVLRQHGYTVILPPFWETDESQLALELEVIPTSQEEEAADSNGSQQSKRPAFLTLNTLVEFKWHIALGKEKLSEEEFNRIVEERSTLIRAKGQWFRLDRSNLERSLRFLKQRLATREQKKLGELIQYANTTAQGSGVRIRRFHLLAQGTESPSFTILPAPPANFTGTMPRYQLYGYSWILYLFSMELGACLADDMGLGKTIQAIAVLLHLYNTHSDAPPSLIVCPMSVVGNWAYELRRFAPSLRIMVHHGQDRAAGNEFKQEIRKYHVIISTYNLIVRDEEEFLNENWHCVVLDEAQNIKNSQTKQARVVLKLKARHRLCLTGTPIENRLLELWSIMQFLNPGLLGTRNAFNQSFAQPIEQEHDRGRAHLLKNLIRPFILRRLKSDREIVRDLPEKHEMTVHCSLSVEQATLYKQTVEQMLSQIRKAEGMQRRGLVVATLIRLKQICNHPLHFLRDNSPFLSVRSGKLQRLEEMLSVVLEEGDKALVFTQFAEFGTLLQRKLSQYFDQEILYLHGQTPQRRRDEMVARFNKPHGPSIFILSLRAGGLGLNLAAANHVFHFDRWWNPAVEDQATDRSYRIGQTKNVQVHKFVCSGTIEEKIDELLETKRKLCDEVITNGEHMITELSYEELEKLLTLDAEAVIE